jgi:predicted CopG family antitoxin
MIARRIIVNLQKIKRSKKSVTPIVKQLTKNRRRIIKMAVKVKRK